MLRKQKGFQDEITFVGPAGTEAFGVSLWDNKESADAYSRGALRRSDQDPGECGWRNSSG